MISSFSASDTKWVSNVKEGISILIDFYCFPVLFLILRRRSFFLFCAMSFQQKGDVNLYILYIAHRWVTQSSSIMYLHESPACLAMSHEPPTPSINNWTKIVCNFLCARALMDFFLRQFFVTCYCFMSHLKNVSSEIHVARFYWTLNRQIARNLTSLAEINENEAKKNRLKQP